MSLLKDLTELLNPLLPVDTGGFGNKAPDEYLVFTPVYDDFGLYADNKPQIDIFGIRIAL